MRSGPIKAETAEKHIDRHGEIFALWERGAPAAVDLPWTRAERFDPEDIRLLLASAKSISVTVGATKISRAILDAVIKYRGQGSRVYVYADRSLEADTTFIRVLSDTDKHILVRTGYQPPADWLIVDQGRDGRLVMGASATTRHWILSVDDKLARSLFEAFRVLFWFHAAREALPDTAGTVAFRTPLKAPSPNPGDDVLLASGRLRIRAKLEDPVPDAEIRLSPVPTDAGPTRVLFIPPGEVSEGGTNSVRKANTTIPLSLAERGQRVVWTNLDLPRTTVTRQRLIFDLLASPIALQLELPRASAIDMFHRFERLANQPEWEFYPQRRLGDVRGAVLIDGAEQVAHVLPSTTLVAGDIQALITEFDSIQPQKWPEIPPLAVNVTIQWKRLPATVPFGARKAEVVRQWTAVDEWASRQVDTLQTVLNELNQQEGLFERLLSWLPSRDPVRMKRRKLLDEIDELGEAPPSQTPDQAKENIARLEKLGVEVMELQHAHYKDHQDGVDADAQNTQRAAWDNKIKLAEEKLKEKLKEIADNEEAQKLAHESEQAALSALNSVVAEQRNERKAELEANRSSLYLEKQEAQESLQRLDEEHKGRPSKSVRKEAQRRLQEAEQALKRIERDLDGITVWDPPLSSLGEAKVRLDDARNTYKTLRAAANQLSAEQRKLERQVTETFQFVPPPRLSVPVITKAVSPPPVPKEAPPELGELFEYQGKRFLAIRTWEQLKPAERVAGRLSAEIVVSTTSK